jgi:hypothetical protein
VTLIIRRDQLAALQCLKDGPLAEAPCRQLRSAHADLEQAMESLPLRLAPGEIEVIAGDLRRVSA